MPKVSVIIPVFRVEKYIERCVRCLFNQTLDNIEFIFVDDCTPDKSIEIISQLLEEYKLYIVEKNWTIRIERMSTNSGQAAVRQHGIQLATGEYSIHCDSDDWVQHDMYRAMYEKAVSDDVDVVVCDYNIHDGNDTLQVVKGCHSIGIVKFRESTLLKKDSWALWNKLFNRRVFTKEIQYPICNMGEDMVICIQLLFNCRNMSYIQNALYFYFNNNSSITNKRDSSIHIRNFEHLKNNTDILINYLYDKEIRHKKWIINGLQYNATITLLNIIHNDKKFREIWMNTYPGANLLYIFNPYINIMHRFKCCLALIGLYPLRKDRL